VARDDAISLQLGVGEVMASSLQNNADSSATGRSMTQSSGLQYQCAVVAMLKGGVTRSVSQTWKVEEGTVDG
jgi:hypothetical protein